MGWRATTFQLAATPVLPATAQFFDPALLPLLVLRLHLRTSNVVESPFAALRLRTDAAHLSSRLQESRSQQ